MSARTPRRPPQISVGFMLLMMVIFALVSAGLFYAARVPAIRQDLAILTGGEAEGGDEQVGRLAQIAFIMFTFTSPLLLAGLLSTVLAVYRWIERRG